jgi:hypothetical protein
MAFPKSVMEVIESTAVRYKEDAEKATRLAIQAIQKLPEYSKFVDGLVADAVGTLIHRHRYESNRQMRNDVGWYSERSARIVKTETSKGVLAVAESVFNYRVAGTILGKILGKEMELIASREERSGVTHMANAKLLRQLQKIVPENSTVEEAITEKSLRRMMKKVGCQPE